MLLYIINFLINHIFTFIKSHPSFKKYNSNEDVNPIIYFIKAFLIGFDYKIYRFEMWYMNNDKDPLSESPHFISWSIPTENKFWDPKELKPSQDQLYMGTIIGMAINTLRTDGIVPIYEGILVSPSKRILDGHHRWAATILNSSSGKIQGTEIKLSRIYMFWIMFRIPFRRIVRFILKKTGAKNIGYPEEKGDINIFNASIEEAMECIKTGKYINPSIRSSYTEERAIRWLEFIGGEKELEERLSYLKTKL